MDRAHRLSRRADFASVRAARRSWAHPLLVVQVAPREGLVRFGLVVSKRIGKAHDRNKVKRRLRALCRERLPRMHDGHDVVIIARSGAASATYMQLDEALAQLFRRARLLRETTA